MFRRRKRSLAAAWREIDNLKEKTMAEQEAVDALTTAVGQVQADLATATSTIQTELDTLKSEIAAGNPPNLEALTAAVGALDPAVQALAALKPA